MKRFASILLMFLCVASTGTALAETKINVSPHNGSEPYFGTDNDGNLYLAHYGADGVLYVIKNKSAEGVKIRVEGAKGTSVWMGFPDNKPSLVWRPKFGHNANKYVYFQQSAANSLDFGKETVLNTAKDALTPISAAYKDKMVFIAWPDERESPISYFMNYSLDGGKTFQKDDINMTPGFAVKQASFLLGENKHYFFFFGRAAGQDKTGIYMRTSVDGSKWTDITQVAPLEDWAPAAIEAIMTEKGPVIFCPGVIGLYYAYLDGDKWQSGFVKGTEKMKINRLSLQRGKKGGYYLLTSYSAREVEKEKPNVYFLNSEDGRTWSAPLKINHNQYDNTSAKFPDLYVADNGTIFAVWLDYRLIRGNIYLNYSKDGGKTWLGQDINLDERPGESNDYMPVLAGHKDRLYVLMPRFKNDSLNPAEIDLYLKEVAIGE